MRKIFSILLFFFIFYSCKHELENPTWDIDTIFPIAHSKLNISNIVLDNFNNVTIPSDSLITLIFRQDLINIELDSIIKIESIADEQIHTLDSASFNDVIIIDSSNIGETINEIPFGNLLFPNGSLSTIPNLPSIITNDTVNIDASEYFETMTLYSGTLSLKILNGFPTDISNVTMSLINKNNLSTIGTFSFPLIPSGSLVSDSISVAGQTLDENIIGVLHNIDINSSNGNVMINYSDAIETTITLSNIGITEATAIFPEQQLTETLKEHSFELDGVKLSEIGIKNGSVKVNVLSTLPNGKMIYKIPSLKKDGIPFNSGEMIVPEANSSDLTTFNFEFEGYTLDLTGKQNRIGGDTINTIYTEAYTYIDSTGEIETINYLDSFYSYIEFDLTPEYAIGYLGNEIFEINDKNILFSIFNNVSSGTFDLNNANMTLSLKNYIGAEANLRFNDFYFDNTNDESPPKYIGLDQDNNNIIGYNYNIERAYLNNENTTIIHSEKEILFEASDIIELFPNKMHVDATLELNPLGENTNIPDFIFPENTLEANIDLEIPLSIIADNLVIQDFFEVNINENQDYEIDEFYITIINDFPLEAEINIISLDENDLIIDTLINKFRILPANISNASQVIPTNSTTKITNRNFIDIKKIKVTSTFSTPNEIVEPVNIYNHYEIEFYISAKYTHKIGEN